jgi:hypothetical protein
MKQYTVLFALTQDLRFGLGLGEIPRHECYHHLARVAAPDPIAAEECCRLSALPGFSYQTLVMFEGHPGGPRCR